MIFLLLQIQYELLKLLVILMIVLFIDLIVLFLLLKLLGKIVRKSSKTKFSSQVDEEKIIGNNKPDNLKRHFTIGFFHPFCNSGGGGERVLWSAINAIQKKFPNCICVVYTGDREANHDELVRKPFERFNIELDPARTQFIYLRFRSLVLDKYYPVFTLLGQSIGSLFLGLEAFSKFIPDIYFETTGYAFTYPLFYYFGNIPVCCYTHYPTISTDMLDVVQQQRANFNNRAIISRSQWLTKLKLYYYRLFARLYMLCGRCSMCIMTNSSWTHDHIEKLWSMTYKTKTV